MLSRTTRRELLGAALGFRVAARCGETSALAEETPQLTIALLDEHWNVLQPMFESYADLNAIDFDAIPLSFEDLYSQLSLALTQRADTFDVVMLADQWIPQFASFLTALDVPADTAAMLSPIAYSVSCFPVDASPCALPLIGETQFFVDRPDWLEREQQSTPTTWDETVETASTIAAELDPDEQRAAFAIRSLSSHQITESFIPILRGYGKAIFDVETSIPQLDTPEALAAMETLLALATLSPEESTAEGAPDNAKRFAQGEISMMSNFWAGELLAARDLEMQSPPGPMASTLQPAQRGVPQQAMTGIWLAAIPVGSLVPDAARTFLDWMTSAEVQKLLPGLSLPPVRVDVLNDPGLVDQFPDLPVLRAMLETATPRPRSPFYPQLEQLLATELAKALAGEVSGADAMRNANVAIREFLVREGVLAA